MATDKKLTLDELIGPAVAALGYEFVGCEFLSQGRHSLVRVYIDKPEGISVDDCALASQQISAVFEVADPIKGEYNLEVSSPGMYRPIFTVEQMQAFVGQQMRIKTSEPIATRRNFCGVLLGLEGEVVLLQVDDKEYRIAFNKIDKAHLEPKW